LNKDHFMRIIIVFIALLAAGCSSDPQRDEPSPHQGATPAHRLLDQGCFEDCMGVNAGKDFCEDRCTW
jgi:hypothetical protein